MVCQKCEKKTSKVAAPDPFKSTSQAIKEGSRTVGGKASSSKARFQPYQLKCKVCGSSTTQNGAKYCHGCAYKKGACAICGKKVLDTTGYAMSSK